MGIPTAISFSSNQVIVTPISQIQTPHPSPSPPLPSPRPRRRGPRARSRRFPGLRSLSPACCRLPRPWPQLGALAVCGGADAFWGAGRAQQAASYRAAGTQGPAHPTPGAASPREPTPRTTRCLPVARAPGRGVRQLGGAWLAFGRLWALSSCSDLPCCLQGLSLFALLLLVVGNGYEPQLNGIV